MLVTGDMPTKEQAKSLSVEWAKRAHLPKHVKDFLNTVPTTLHPMCQFSCAVALLSHDSQFQKAYNAKVPRLDFWKYFYEDSMTLIANITLIAAKIYMRTYKNDEVCGKVEIDKDWSQNFCNLIGYDNEEFCELMRMYLTIHCDHEGGNVSAHTHHLVCSALSDPFISYASALNGLAGPLHGLANQEVLKWILVLNEHVGGKPNEENVREFILKTLKTSVVPGFGHAVLRATDPRYNCQQYFAEKFMPDSDLIKIVKILFKVVPGELKKLGKVQNPWPNVDAHSGVLLYYYGMKEMTYYTVLFGISRCLGVLAQTIWSRALMFPIERPKSITTYDLMKKFNYQYKGKEYQKCKQ